jgi:cytochrome P450
MTSQSQHSSLPTGIQLMALDPDFRDNPYPILAELRAREPIHYDEQFSRYVFTRHDDVFAILRNPDYWSDPRKGLEGGFAREYLGRGDEEPSMLLMDEPEHQRLRNLVRRPFTPGAVEQWRSRTREIAKRVIDDVEEGEFDLTARIAKPIPTVVIAELLGIDPKHHERFKRWSDASIKVGFSPINDPADVAAAQEAEDALVAFFQEEIDKRKGHPGEDLISSMLTAREAGDRLTDAEIISQCTLLLLAGNLTTTDLIGNAVNALIRHPDQLEKLRERPELMKNAIDEVLRYDSPVTNSGRIAHEDIEIDGVKIRKGESLSVSLAAANRDPAVYPDPDRFDIEREDTHHQAFGGGRHFCLGSHLARLEAAETLFELMSRFSRLSLGEGGHRYAANPSFRGFEEFWVRGEA